MRCVIDCPNFFPEITWPFLNILSEGPGGAAGSPVPNFPYENYTLGVGPFAEYRTDGTEAALGLAIQPLNSNDAVFNANTTPSFEYRASGGTAPYDFTTTLSQTVAGITGASTVDDEDGYFLPLSGTPTEQGTIAGTITVTDAAGQVTQLAFTRAVNAPVITGWQQAFNGADGTALETLGWLREGGSAGAIVQNGNGGLRSVTAGATYWHPKTISNPDNVWVEAVAAASVSTMNLVIELQGGGRLQLVRIANDRYTAVLRRVDAGIGGANDGDLTNPTNNGSTLRLEYRKASGRFMVSEQNVGNSFNGGYADLQPTGRIGVSSSGAEGAGISPMLQGPIKAGRY